MKTKRIQPKKKDRPHPDRFAVSVISVRPESPVRAERWGFKEYNMAYIKTYDPREWVEFTDKDGDTIYARKGEVRALWFRRNVDGRAKMHLSITGTSCVIVGAKQINKILRALGFNRVPKKYGHRMANEYGRSPKNK